MITKPLKLRAKQLFFNVSCKAGGNASVEMLDDFGESLGTSHPVTRDGVRQPVRWKKDVDLTSLSGRMIRLKIHMKNASLYAIWTE